MMATMMATTARMKRLEKIERLNFDEAGEIIIVTSHEEAETLRAGPHDTIIVTGVPRSRDSYARKPQ